MKIFKDNAEAWGEKVNFVDAFNVLVGYDMSSQCCENADWFISEKELTETIEDNGITEGLETYHFDRTYCVEIEFKEGYEGGGIVRFRLISLGKPDLFLHIYNHHNGYYSHGFVFQDGEEILKSGDI